MINEDMTQKEFSFAQRVSDVTTQEIRKILEKFLTDVEQGKYNPLPDKKPELKHGKQTLKQLQEHNDGLSTVELKDPNLRELYHSLKKMALTLRRQKMARANTPCFSRARTRIP